MFFIMGISQGEKKLNFNQLAVCRCCGKYGHMEVVMLYSYLSLFFIPVLKWGKRYFVRMSCCGESVEIDKELGRKIHRGEVTRLPEDIIPHKQYKDGFKKCGRCGFATEEDYLYCPKCGNPF